MQTPAKSVLTGLFFFCLFLCDLNAQDLSWDDSLRTLIFKPLPSRYPVRLKCKSDLDYSISIAGDYFVNWLKNDNASQLALSHSLKYKICLSGNGHFHFTGDLVHNLGIQYYFDSISRFRTDDNTLTSKLTYDVSNSLHFSVLCIFNTRIFNSWDIATLSNGSVLRILNSAFLTPLLCTFSGGLGLKFGKSGSLDIGVASAKLTYLRDRSVFGQSGLQSFYGVPYGKRSLFEYGLSMQLLIDRLIGKHMQWNCDLLLFKDNNSPVDVTLKNLFAYRISRYFKTSLQTRLFYEEKVSRQVRLENLISLGFDFHL
jgi:hypothetical protein